MYFDYDDERGYFESLYDEDPAEEYEPEDGEECLTAAERNPSMLRGR